MKIGYKLKTGNEVFRYTYLKSLDIKEGGDLMLQLDRYRQDKARNSTVRLVIQVCYQVTASGKASRKRRHSEAIISSSPPQSGRTIPVLIRSSPPTARDKQDTFRTRTLKDRLQIRGESYQVRGQNQQSLVERYSCIDTSCANHPNYCWIELVGCHHYAISAIQLKRWSIAIEIGNTTLDNPPLDLIVF